MRRLRFAQAHCDSSKTSLRNQACAALGGVLLAIAPRDARLAPRSRHHPLGQWGDKEQARNGWNAQERTKSLITLNFCPSCILSAAIPGSNVSLMSSFPRKGSGPLRCANDEDDMETGALRHRPPDGLRAPEWGRSCSAAGIRVLIISLVTWLSARLCALRSSLRIGAAHSDRHSSLGPAALRLQPQLFAF